MWEKVIDNYLPRFLKTQTYQTMNLIKSTTWTRDALPIFFVIEEE